MILNVLNVILLIWFLIMGVAAEQYCKFMKMKPESIKRTRICGMIGTACEIVLIALKLTGNW